MSIHQIRSVPHDDRVPRSLLTTREQQVLDLVADGLTNAEIGRRLFLSINSVKTYLRHAYSKIGVHRRTQAAAWVLARRESEPPGSPCPTCGHPTGSVGLSVCR